MAKYNDNDMGLGDSYAILKTIQEFCEVVRNNSTDDAFFFSSYNAPNTSDALQR